MDNQKKIFLLEEQEKQYKAQVCHDDSLRYRFNIKFKLQS